jgi:Ran GTPase-activating protein (RanGAP) involved in mRNA processing and transport
MTHPPHHLTFEKSLSLDGLTFTLARLGRFLAITRLQMVLQEYPKVQNLILQQMDLCEPILDVLAKLACDRAWKSWKVVDCRMRSSSVAPDYPALLYLEQPNVQIFMLQTTTTFSSRRPEDAVQFLPVGRLLHSKNSVLQYLRLSFYELDVVTALGLSQGLEQTTSLVDLCLSGTRRCGRHVELLSRGLQRNRTLTSLGMADCQLSDECIADLVTALQGHATLGSLDLSNNSCAQRGLLALREMVAQTPNLHTLDLKMQRQRLDLSLLAPALHSNTSLKKLGLSNTSLQDDDVMCLVDALLHNTTLQDLDLSDNRKVSDVALLHLAQRLPRLHLVTLNLRKLQNRGSESVLQAMAEGMRDNDTLQLLRIHYWRHVQYTRQILFCANANRGGRRILRQQETVPLGVWPHVMERAFRKSYFCPLAQQAGIDNTYYLLRNAPVLWEWRR